ncbi:putative 6-hexanolactone hydrolase [Fonsecaea pedrosoi]|nr:putative 6-hexanolactone hydrolase [Fonsecaea pedrosoi]
MARSQAHAERNDVIRAGMTSLETALSATVPTKDTVASETARLGSPVKTEEIPDSEGAKIHWIGDSSAPSVILYFHGGGLGIPAMPGHVSFLVDTQQRLAAKEGKKLSIAFVEYGETETINPVIVGGDSAGGNLAVAILSATAHSHPGIPSLKLDAPLKGALLVSPWIDLSVGTSKSWVENKDKDIVSANIVDPLVNNLVSKDERNEFTDPARADSKWWSGAQVSSILTLAGTHELFFDDIVKFSQKLKAGGLNEELVECPQQVHIDCFLDAQSGLEHGTMSHAIWDWLKKLL